MLNISRLPNTKFSRSLLTILLAWGYLGHAGTAYANEFDMRISDDAIHANFTLTNSSSGQFGLGYFYKNEDEAINILNIDMHTKGQTAIANMPTTIGIGFQANLFKEDDFKGSAIGIGGSMRVNIPEVPGLSFESDIHYAPEVLSFGDSDEFRRLRLQTNYRIIENADISVGYRYLNAGQEDIGNHTFESGAFLGLKLNF